MTTRNAAAFWLPLAAMAMVTAWSAPSWAWKPYTHVYLAEQAYLDAVDDGFLTIYKVDPATGKPAMNLVWSRGPGPRDAPVRIQAPVVLARIKVQPRILRALQASPAKFFAGVLGPDAYPDIVTGQMRIHPPGADAAALNAPVIPDDNSNGPGTDAWLQVLWSKAWQSDSDDQIAFATGYLVHAAGDIYAHTFMNTYAGGIFDLQDTSLNWLKHVTVEGYIGERTPEPDPIPALSNPGSPTIYDLVRTSGITGIEGFIADNTWDVRDASNHALFPQESNKSKSVPYLLGRLGEIAPRVNGEVQAFVSGLDSEWSRALYNASPVGTFREGLWACHVSNDCPDPAYATNDCPTDEYPRNDRQHPLLCAGFVALGHPGAAAWSSAWASYAATLDVTVRTPGHVLAFAVDRWTSNATQVVPIAMRDWVTASHNTAVHLFFTRDHLMHLDAAETPGSPSVADGYEAFRIDMASILSGIDRGSVASLNDLIGIVMAPVANLRDLVGDAKHWVQNQVFQAMFHMTEDQAKQCFVKPHMWLNPLLRNNLSGMSGTLVALNRTMHLPQIAPATCGGSPGDRCTINPSLVGSDVVGACDLLAGGAPAKFSVKVSGTGQEVFPAAFNALTMIKLVLADPDEVDRLANSLPHAAGVPLGVFRKPNWQPNPMLGFAATIDGSNDWLAQRLDAGWGSRPMVFAQDCNAYANVFLDQRPSVDAQGQPITGSALAQVKPRLLSSRTMDPTEQAALASWEPAELPCLQAPTAPPDATSTGAVNFPFRLVDTRATNGYAEISVNEPARFALASAGPNGFDAAMTRGSLSVAADGKTARYLPPKWNPLGRDQIVITSRDGRRRAIVPITLESPLRAAYRRDVPTGGDPTGLRGGDTALLVAPGGSAMRWTVVSGPGTVGDARLEATRDATLAAPTGRIASSETLIARHVARLNDAACAGACRSQAVEAVRAAAQARVVAAADLAQTQRQLDDARATYHAPPTVTRDEVVTLRGVAPDGKTATVKQRLVAPPPPLQVKLAGTTLRPGAQIKLDVDAGVPPVGTNTAPGVPMTWQIVSGPGTVGDPASKERGQYTAQQQAFFAGLEPLSKQVANARPFEVAAARKALLDYIQASLAKYGPAFAKLDEIDGTYHAPATVAGKQRGTLRGTARDSSGRTVDASFELAP